jgi:hypothetical protein
VRFAILAGSSIRRPRVPTRLNWRLRIAKNGMVRNAVAEGAPTREFKSRIEQQAHEWMFEPYLKDGIGVSIKLNTSVYVNVMKSR